MNKESVRLVGQDVEAFTLDRIYENIKTKEHSILS